MTTAKTALGKSDLGAAVEPISVAPAVDPTTSLVTVNIFDGTRELIQAGTQVLFTITDGAQNRLFRDFISSSAATFKLPIHNNFADNYSIVAWAKDYEQAGFQPVTVGPNAPQIVDLMLLPRESSFHFGQARWNDIVARRPQVSEIFAASDPGDPSTIYGQLMEDHPERLACLLNITTALQQISLPNGTPLDYFKTFDLPALAPDRIFGYADATLVDQVKLAAQQGELIPNPLSI